MSAWRAEAAALTRLALPVVLVQLGMMSMGVVDVMMVGRVSEVDLAAVNIGHSYSFAWMGAAMGVLMALDPLVSQSWGARDEEGVARSVQRGLVLALLLSVPTILVILPAAPALRLLGQVPEVVPAAAGYARAIAPGVPLFLIFVVLRHTLQAMHVLRPIAWTIVLANLANAGLNRVLIFGAFGIEPMGAVGSAWATTLCRLVMTLVLLTWAWPVLARYLVPRAEAFAPGPILRTAWLGAPIGVQVLAEVGAFGLMSLLVGTLGATEAGGSTIALNLASLTFMVPLGVSTAASIRVGHAIGRGDPEAVRRAARVALAFGGLFMLLAGVLFLSAPRALSSLYTDDEAVVAVAASLLPLAALFQVFDGLQTVSTGVLRGSADVRVPMLIHLAGFWVVAIPLGWWLGVAGERSDPRGVWAGLTAGLVLVAIVLLLRVRALLKRRIGRVDVEGSALEPVPGPTSSSA